MKTQEVQKSTYIIKGEFLGFIPKPLIFGEVKMTKTQQVAGFDLAAKWQKKRYGLTSEEGWFILTNLGSLEQGNYCLQETIWN